MYLDDRQTGVGKSVAHGQAIVRESARVDYYPIRFVRRLLYEVNYTALVVRLEEGDLDVQLCGLLGNVPLNVGESSASVALWITSAEIVEVRAIDYQYLHRLASRPALSA